MIAFAVMLHGPQSGDPASIAGRVGMIDSGAAATATLQTPLGKVELRIGDDSWESADEVSAGQSKGVRGQGHFKGVRSTPLRPRNRQEGSRRSAKDSRATPGCGGRRGGWAWDQRRAIRGGPKKPSPAAKKTGSRR
jgi:hypothetical protein